EKGGYRPNIPADPAMIGLDDPLHHKRRGLVSRRFTPRAVSEREDHVRATVSRLFDAVEANGGEAEIVDELAAPLPAMTIGRLLGVDTVISDCLLLLDGGAETTRTVIARTILNLVAHPDQWDLLRNGTDLAVATEEFIRYITPIHNMCRVARTGTEVAGQEIR